jgi:hypothetical protein
MAISYYISLKTIYKKSFRSYITRIEFFTKIGCSLPIVRKNTKTLFKKLIIVGAA